MKKIMKIRIYGDSVLTKKAKPVEAVDEEILQLGRRMIDTMFAFDGLGLAAPQVGVSLRMFAIGVPLPKSENGRPLFLSPGEVQLIPRMPLVLINPEITDFSATTEIREEGCLSFPDMYASVKRPALIIIKAQILGAEEITVECGGLLARAIQHEFDHLDGILFIDRLTNEARRKMESQLAYLIKQGRK